MASATSTICVAAILGVLLSNASLASATPSNSFNDHFFGTDKLFGARNATGGPVEEIKCYALPYGAIGAVSHLLTLWVIAWMSVGKAPLWPFFDMTKYKFDMFLACLALCTCIPLASITMHSCRLSWHFLLICIWKLLTSVSLACTTLHRCWIIRQEGTRTHGDNPISLGDYQAAQHHESHDSGTGVHKNRPGFFSDMRQKMHKSKYQFDPLYWLSLYLAGTVVGMVGLLALLWSAFKHDATIRHLTYGYIATLAIVPACVAVFWYVHHLEESEGGWSAFWWALGQTLAATFVAFVFLFGAFSPLYSDLVLGSIAKNMLGTPSDGFAALYWAWFVAKRLPLLSF